MLKYYTLMFTLIIVLWSWQSSADVTKTLDEAEAYLTVNPAYTKQLLDSIAQPDKLAVDVALRRYILMLRAAVPTNDMDRLIQILQALFVHQQHPEFVQHLTPITSALGIWLRRNNYLHAAQSSFSCSYKHSTTHRQRLALTNSLALVARQLGETDQARTLFNSARQQAQQSDQTNVLAMAENNLGLLALDENDLAQAEIHFRAALGHYQSVSLRAGQISAGINLLFVFLLQQDMVNFQRLYSPTANLTASFPNEAKQALLFWLHKRFLHLQGHNIDARTHQQLIDSYAQMEDDKVRILAQRYLAEPLGVAVVRPEASAHAVFEQAWFSNVIKCDWPLSDDAPPLTIPAI